MGVYVSDGILLGIVTDPKRIKKSNSKLLDHNEALAVITGAKQNKTSYSLEDAQMHLVNVIKMNNEDAKAIVQENNPYETDSDFYLGIFWECSNRRSLNLDNEMKILYKKISKSEQAMKESKNGLLGQRVYEIAHKLIKDLKPEEIQLFEARFFE
jgi:hypothetical protein